MTTDRDALSAGESGDPVVGADRRITAPCPAGCQVIALDGEDDFDAEAGGHRLLTGSVQVGGGTLESWDTCPTCNGQGTALIASDQPKKDREPT